jgi:hypothetical protein
VNNTNERSVKNIEITCRHPGRSESQTHVVYQLFPPGPTRVDSYDMGLILDDPRTMTCSVTAASPG